MSIRKVIINEEKGCIIKFKDDENIINLDNIFSIEYENKPHYFKVYEFETISEDSDAILVTAKEIGYSYLFKNSHSFDITSLIDINPILVVDEATINKINQQNRWI